jgi:hypothetical protein
MFGAIIRAVGVLVAGSLIAYVMFSAGGALVDAQQDVGYAENQEDRVENWQWADRIITWWPAIPIATIVAILIGSAIERRRRTRI